METASRAGTSGWSHEGAHVLHRRLHFRGHAVSHLVGEDRGHRRELGRLTAELDALWALTRRTVSEAAVTGVPGVGASFVKLHYSELLQRIGDLALRLIGADRLTLDEPWIEERLRVLALPIAAGSSQIQRNIIGERVLGLPKS